MPNPMTVTDTASAVRYLKAAVDGFLADAMRHVERAALTEGVVRDSHMEAARDALAEAEALRERIEACRV